MWALILIVMFLKTNHIVICQIMFLYGYVSSIWSLKKKKKGQKRKGLQTTIVFLDLATM